MRNVSYDWQAIEELGLDVVVECYGQDVYSAERRARFVCEHLANPARADKDAYEELDDTSDDDEVDGVLRPNMIAVGKINTEKCGEVLIYPQGMRGSSLPNVDFEDSAPLTIIHALRAALKCSLTHGWLTRLVPGLRKLIQRITVRQRAEQRGSDSAGAHVTRSDQLKLQLIDEARSREQSASNCGIIVFNIRI